MDNRRKPAVPIPRLGRRNPFVPVFRSVARPIRPSAPGVGEAVPLVPEHIAKGLVKVPMPKSFSGKLTTDISRVDTWYDGLLRYLDRYRMDPLVYFWDYLSGKAAEWGLYVLDEHKSGRRVLTRDKLREVFLAQYGDPKRKPGMTARKRLMALEHQWQPGDTVTTYSQRMQSIAREAPNLTEEERILHFLAGLPSALRADCMVDAEHHDWSSLEDLETFARGEEQKCKERRAGTKRPFADLNFLSPPRPSSAQVRRKGSAGAGPSGSRPSKDFRCYGCNETFKSHSAMLKHKAECTKARKPKSGAKGKEGKADKA